MGSSVDRHGRAKSQRLHDVNRIFQTEMRRRRRTRKKKKPATSELRGHCERYGVRVRGTPEGGAAEKGAGDISE